MEEKSEIWMKSKTVTICLYFKVCYRRDGTSKAEDGERVERKSVAFKASLENQANKR